MKNEPLNRFREAIDLRAQQAIRMVLEGVKARDIAEILGVYPWTVYNWLRQPEARAQIAEKKAELIGILNAQLEEGLLTKSQVIDQLGWKALERMREILDDPTAHKHIVAKVAIDVLDRDPVVSKTKRLDITTKNITLSGEDLLHAVKSLQEVEARTAEKTAEKAAEVPNDSSK